MKPKEIVDQTEYDVMKFTEKKTLDLDLKLLNIKKGKMLDNNS